MSTATAVSATCNRASLLEALVAVSGVVPARSPRAILQNVLLSLSPDGSEFLATDLELGVHHRILGIQCDEPMRLVLPPVRLRSILATSDDETVYLAAEGDHVVIRTRRAEFRLPLEDASLFPEAPTFGAGDYHEVTGADLKRLISRTSYAADHEGSVRYALGGAMVEPGDETLAFVATDGRRLARQVVAATRIGEGIPQGKQSVLPVKTLKLISRVADDDETASVSLSESALLVKVGAATIYSRLVEGRFPDYKSVFPSEPATKIHFPEVAELRVAIEQASIVCSEESRGCDLRFGDGVLKLSSQAADVGSSIVDLPINFEGDEILICFDPRYCLDMLKAMDGDEALTVELIGSKHPAVFRSETGMAACIMPLTRDR